MDDMFGPGASIEIFEPLSQRMSSDADNGIHLRVKGFGAAKGVHGDAVLLDFVDCSFEILFTNKRQKPNMVVGPPEYAGRQKVLYFSPLGFKFVDRRLQLDTPRKRSLRSLTPS